MGACHAPAPGSRADLGFRFILTFFFPFRAHTGVTSWLVALCFSALVVAEGPEDRDGHASPPLPRTHTRTQTELPFGPWGRKREEAAAVTPGPAFFFSPALFFQQRKVRTQRGGPRLPGGCLSWAAPCLYVCVHMHIDPRVYINKRHLPTHAHQRRRRHRLSGHLAGGGGVNSIYFYMYYI